ncbi:MAG: hypothetical protein HY925_07285 [Elusimicrobia bacterium]|nr:hypothetical protein [Elusimicrobiota bacterium]
MSRWDYFVLRHQKPGNLAIHFVSMLCFYGGPVAALAARDARWLGFFFVSGLIGGFGPWYFEDGRVDFRELTSRPEVPHYVVVMFWLLSQGRWAEETRLARERALAAQVV